MHNHKQYQTRLKRIDGQLHGIIGMLDSDRSCSDLLMQLSAVEKAIRSVSREILKDHMNHCVVDALEKGDKEPLAEFDKILDTYLK